ncbi:NAD-dependent epimerase/dehydratase family protein [Dactylosporangium sp. NBC_01737]|uniref:NAD-dependent epimerase/dehydratase family protein n=1 Tax=Dactylosporangium sp. NBC_01737 TaxID=2975959 RepID=UPI002E11D4DB|nr:NAD-dependent epimerase/dehydratase family protein [Dactylosporangium sp. NBC_01737]
MESPGTPPLIAVLGASGLVGTALTRRLADRPVRLRLVGRRPAVVPPGARADVEVRAVDLTAPGALAAAIDGADVVIHLVAFIEGPSSWRVAADDPVAEKVNLGLVHDLIDAVRAQQRPRPPLVLFAGSMSQAGRSSLPRIDGTEPDAPLTAYDRQKLAGEQALEAAHADGLLRGVTLRLATIYSQGTDPVGLDRGVAASMVRRAIAGQPLTVWHDGTMLRDLLCVDDAADAFVAAIDHAEALEGRHWLIGTGVGISIADLFGTIAKVVSTHTGQPPVPVVPVPPAAHSMPTDAIDFVLDPSAFCAAAHWTPRIGLSDGLDRLAVATVRDEERS